MDSSLAFPVPLSTRINRADEEIVGIYVKRLNITFMKRSKGHD